MKWWNREKEREGKGKGKRGGAGEREKTKITYKPTGWWYLLNKTLTAKLILTVITCWSGDNCYPTYPLWFLGSHKVIHAHSAVRVITTLIITQCDLIPFSTDTAMGLKKGYVTSQLSPIYMIMLCIGFQNDLAINRKLP